MAKKQKAAAADAHGAGGEEAAPKRKMSGKKLVLFIILPLVLIVGGTATLLFSGVLGGSSAAHAETAEAEGEHGSGEHGGEAATAAPTAEHGGEAAAEGHGEGGAAGGPGGQFVELPDMLVNLNTAGGRSAVMKVALSVELAKTEDKPALEAAMPRVQDQFQSFLRQLRRDDLQGSAGMYRLKEELRARVDLAASPVKVRDVLIREMIVQ